MKLKATSLLSLSVIILSAFIFTTSCKKSNNGPSTGLSANVNGSAFNADTVGGADHYGILLFTGVRASDSSTITISLLDSAAINKPLTLDHSNFNAVSYTKGFRIYSSEVTNSHGSLTITSWDKSGKKVAGQFSGIFYNVMGSTDSLAIINGQFNTSYK